MQKTQVRPKDATDHVFDLRKGNLEWKVEPASPRLGVGSICHDVGGYGRPDVCQIGSAFRTSPAWPKQVQGQSEPRIHQFDEGEEKSVGITRQAISTKYIGDGDHGNEICPRTHEAHIPPIPCVIVVFGYPSEQSPVSAPPICLYANSNGNLPVLLEFLVPQKWYYVWNEAIIDRIEQTSANKQGLDESAARIQLLTPIVSEMVTNKPREGKRIVEGLERELESITEDLEAASQRGTLDQFFNSAENTSSLAKHSMILAQMVADSTLITVHEVLNTLQDIQVEVE
ncbi:hypothetical protein C8R44DRAFT_741200 [Mycena epipterygia]|nr:hypothetical protein C8R44DRAFT_741200 [Mycena epipterygia]